ncbi:MAG: hypothetical protein WCP34_10165 [Pseudomonadota bacterium]
MNQPQEILNPEKSSMESIDTLWAQAQQRAAERHFQDARLVLAQILALDPPLLGAVRLDLGLALMCAEPFDAVERGETLLQAGFDENDVLVNLALAHLNLGEIGSALNYCDRVLARAPAEGMAYLNKAAAYLRIGWYREALAVCEAAEAQGAGSPQVWQNQAVALAGLERWEAVQSLYQMAKTQALVDLKWLMLGVEAFCTLGQNAQALDEVADALEDWKDEDAAALFDALLLGGVPPDAMVRRFQSHQTIVWRRVLARTLNQHGDHGAVLAGFGNHPDEASRMACAVAAAALGDRNRGQAYLDILDTPAARQRFLAYRYEEWRTGNKNDAEVPQQLSATRLWVDSEYERLGRCDWCHWHDLEEQLAAWIPEELAGLGQLPMVPFHTLMMPVSRELALRVAQAAATQIEARFPRPPLDIPPHRPTRKARRLRLGYVSADFRNHATSHLAASLFEWHDRNRFEVFVYSLRPGDGSQYRNRIRKGADVFREIGDEPIDRMAHIIRQDGVDILVDMQGYSQYSRIGLFALRPAPVHVAFLVYPGTTGARFMDYIVADRVVLPESLRPFFTEEPLYLPGCYQIHDPLEAPDGLLWTRGRAGLPEEGVVFCAINQSLKIDPEVFDDWMAILQAVPTGCLWCYRENPWVPGNLRREAAARGVDPARLVFADAIPKTSHLSRLGLADVFLDTYRCNAHTAAADALAAGLPIITRPGERFASRVAASLLTSLGLEDLITTSRAEYVATATRLGSDPALLARYKARVANATTLPAWRDIEGYVRQLEAAFEDAFERNC